MKMACLSRPCFSLLFASMIFAAGGNLHAQTTLSGDHEITGSLKLEDQLIVQDTNTDADPSSFLFGAYDDPLNPGNLIGGFETIYDPEGDLAFVLRSNESNWSWWTAQEDGSSPKQLMQLATDGSLVLFGEDGYGNPIEAFKFVPSTDSSSSQFYVEGTQILQINNGGMSWGGSNVSGENAIAWGSDAIANGQYTTAWASGTATAYYGTAWGIGSVSGSYGTAWGESTASGFFSTAWGIGATSEGDTSTAFGESTSAEGYLSTAWGYGTLAEGSFSTASGYETRAIAHYSTALGIYNVGLGSTNSDPYEYSENSNDVVVEVGGGNPGPGGVRKNAATIFGNGNFRVGGTIEAKAGIRVPPQGDLAMGEFTAGQNPADLDPATGLLYPAP